MEEVCPICADILSEINSMMARGFLRLTMEDVPLVNFYWAFPALSVMYKSEALDHFTEKLLETHGVISTREASLSASDLYQNWLDL